MENETTTLVWETYARHGDCEIQLTAEVVDEDWDNLKFIDVESNINGFRDSKRLTNLKRIQDEVDLQIMARNMLWEELEVQIKIEQSYEQAEYV